MIHMYNGSVSGFPARTVIHYLIISTRTENDYYDILGIPQALLVVFLKNTNTTIMAIHVKLTF